MSNADELLKYRELLDSKIITEEEFEKKKNELLNMKDNINVQIQNNNNLKKSFSSKLGIENNISKKNKKKSSPLGVILLIIVIGFIVAVGSETDRQYEKKSQIKELLKQCSISYEEVDNVLKECGFNNYTLEKSTDNTEIDGLNSLKIQKDDIVASMDIKDSKIYSIKYGDKILYENGAIQHTLSEYVGNTSSNTERFTLISKEGNKDNYGYITITGEIKNNTNKTYTYAQVTFTLYDESGAQVGTAMDNINNFEANGTWKFKAIGLSNGSTTYRCTGITGW